MVVTPWKKSCYPPLELGEKARMVLYLFLVRNKMFSIASDDAKEEGPYLKKTLSRDKTIFLTKVLINEAY